jgi:8-oxo-dGTP pyrophosphatase MutT (NUDIX family)
MGGGVLPVSFHKGEMLFLFGQEYEELKWSDFGGTPNPGESYLQTAVREGSEELNGMLGTSTDIHHLIKTQLLFELELDNHKTFLVQVPYEPYLPLYFNNQYRFIKKQFPQFVGRNGVFEKKQIKWFSLAEIKKNRHLFRPFYRLFTDEIILNEHVIRSNKIKIV